MGYKKYLKHFDKSFKTETEKNFNIDNLPLLKAMYEDFEDRIYNPSSRQIEIMSKYQKLSIKFEETLSEEQQELYEKSMDLFCDSLEDLHQQLFMFGYLIAKELDRESKLYN